MKRNLYQLAMAAVMFAFVSCSSNNNAGSESTAAASESEAPVAGQSGVADDESAKDIVKVAVGSPDHTTLVAALKAAEYVDVLANAGPFTVFAPTNAAFDKLPAGTLDELVKTEKKADLRNILEYHVTLSALPPESFTDGQTIGMVNGDNVTITLKDGKMQVNGANVVANVQASNGMVYIVDGVLLPPAKK